ncbi:MAG: hypothetical protein ACRDKT_02400 [Actinomycetota bacterium]
MKTDPGAPRFTGTFSVVVDHSDAGFRRLPTLYLGSAQLFADRSVDTVVDKTAAIVASTIEAPRRATFLLTPCRVADRVGLYGRDVFNRSIFRIKLEREGVEFATDPYVVLDEDGSFLSTDWGRIRPAFVVLNGAGETPDDVIRSEGALLAFSLATFRIGRFGAADLTALTRAVAGIGSVAALEPAAVVRALSP